MGRTGLRGRGNLLRWGPNHVMYAIVSRWRQVVNSTGTPQGPLLINGKKVLEILVVYNERLKEDSLPGAFVSGRTSKFSVMCEMFMRDLMGEKDVPGSNQLDEDDMIQFYRQFLSRELLLSSLLNRGTTADSKFSSSLIYRGYMDDRFNTDNAWIDAEIWNFHYNGKDKFDKKIVDVGLMKGKIFSLFQNDKHWREVSVLMQLASSQLHHVLEVAKMHNRS
ncbi:transient receptor potential cation channel subfamily m member 2 [Plakobranchus ocellatus]|uniref:Transient receptor potential cation channel subfamily m member 2 n=1 Tax=Plakobranchus ocellatus TaxID=259542 RepID=A0AAV3YJ52_9GAST|nr:transient receptor potential cation channel subfamily m member 2 [Plakobranchus ocellatus]